MRVVTVLLLLIVKLFFFFAGLMQLGLVIMFILSQRTIIFSDIPVNIWFVLFMAFSFQLSFMFLQSPPT